MIPAIRGELKKALSVRSTYAIALFFLVLLGIVSFYGQGYKTLQSDINHLFIANSITPVANIAAIAGGLVGLLLMAHEYRYNTITYTLTSSNSRSKVIAAKMLVIVGLTFVYSIFATAMFLLLMHLGVAAAHHSLPHQDINYLAYFTKIVFYCECFALSGLLVPTLVRNMQASVAILFIVPNTLEGLLGLIIKQPEKWLPFTALNQVVVQPVKMGPHSGTPGDVSSLHGAVVFLIYFVVFWAITWYLFLRRDAS